MNANFHRELFNTQTTFTTSSKTHKTIVYTQEDFRNDINTTNDIYNALGRKYKVILKDIVRFRELLKYNLSRDTFKVIYISTHSDKLNYFFKNQMNIQRLIHHMINVDLLKCVNLDYNVDKNSRRYIFSYKQYDLLIKLIKDNNLFDINIIKEDIKESNRIYNNIIYPYGNIFAKNNNKNTNTDMSDNDLHKLKVSKNLLSENIKGIINDEDLKKVLMKNDDRIKDADKIIKRINNYYYDNPELYVKWEAKSTYRGNKLRKIGMRATSSVCSLPKVQSDEYPRMLRDEYMKKYIGSYKEYDVCSSIYRITYFLNFGEWLDNSVDVYELIYGKQFENCVERNNFKAFCQRIYFGGTDKETARNVRFDDSLKNIFKPLNQSETTDMVNAWRIQMENVIGKIYESEIFVVESLLYANVTLQLLKIGIKTVQIYDAWFVSSDVDDTIIEKCLYNAVNDYMTKYMI